jgi:hypothetical protein
LRIHQFSAKTEANYDSKNDFQTISPDFENRHCSGFVILGHYNACRGATNFLLLKCEGKRDQNKGQIDPEQTGLYSSLPVSVSDRLRNKFALKTTPPVKAKLRATRSISVSLSA